MKDKDTRNEIFNSRIYFLIEVFVVCLGIFLFRTAFIALLDFIKDIGLIDLSIYSALYYLTKLVAGLIAVPIFIAITKIILEAKRKDEVIVETHLSTSVQQLLLLKVTKKNFKYQLLWGVLLLMIVYLPLTILGYILPGAVEIEAEIIINQGLASYLLEPYFTFLIFAIIIQFCSCFYEEWVFRGFMVNRGEQQFNKYSAVMISAIFFGVSHSGYIFIAAGSGESLVYPIFWVISAGIVGFVNAAFLIRKKWLFPLIFAHTISNLVSAHTLWYYSKGGYFQDLFIFLYVPLIILGFIILISQYSRFKKGMEFVANDFKSYFKKDMKLKETGTDRILRIIIDIIIILSIYVFSLIGLGF